MRFYAATLPISVLPLLGSYSLSLFTGIAVASAVINARLAGFRLRLAGLPCLVLLHFALAGLSWVWSSNPAVTATAVRSLALSVVVFLGVAMLDRHESRQLMMPIAIGAAVLSFSVIVAPAQLTRGGRASVMGVDENVTAYAISIGVAITAGLIIDDGHKVSRLLPAASLGLGVIALLHAGSRTGAAAVGVVALVTLIAALHRRGTKKRVRRVVAGIGVGAVAIGSALQLGLVPDRVLTVLDSPSLADDSGRARILELYHSVFDQWWLKGVGYGADASFLGSTTGRQLNAHNQFWASWIELGVAGAIVVVLIGSVALTVALRPTTPAFIKSTVAVVFLFGYTLGGARTDIFWFSLALVSVYGTRRATEYVDDQGRLG